ncbi:uncharacterized protein [Solanum lycopersicum]|uniref:uncharacterized protein n=1 Tax=Solanum lycopersicum TaxID=4081 RepID=UPI003749E0B2
MVVTKTAEVMGKLELLHHKKVGATDRRTIGPIVTLSRGGPKQRHLMLASQKGKVIAYASRQLMSPEKNYPTHDLELEGVISEESDGMIAFIEDRSSLVEQIHAYQFNDEKLCLIQDKVLRGEAKEAVLDSDGVLRIGGRICVRKRGDLIRLILEEAHCSWYSIHPGSAKMYHDLTQHYWWCGMKRDITDVVSRCLTCQQVKCEHQRPGGADQVYPLYSGSVEVYSREVSRAIYQSDCATTWSSNFYHIGSGFTIYFSFLEGIITWSGQSRQKSYGDRRVRALVFMEGGHVWLRVSPMKGVMRFGKKGKLSPGFIGTFEILSRVGEVDYNLALSPSLSAVHTVFHVSMLRKYIPDESHVLSLDSVELSPDLTFEDQPIAILDRQVRKLRTNEIASVNVQ